MLESQGLVTRSRHPDDARSVLVKHHSERPDPGCRDRHRAARPGRMIHKVIRGWNAAPGAPRNWNPERDGECRRSADPGSSAPRR